MSDTLVLIPARYQSARFPGKPLTLLNKIPMIQRVFELCCKSGFDTYVVTDSEEIEECVTKFSGNVLRVDDDVISGTERIALAYTRHLKSHSQYKYIINVQGDEPLLNFESLKRLKDFHTQSSFDVATMVRKEEDEQLKKEVNRVKVAYAPDSGSCLYFSRSAIPYPRNKDLSQSWYHHIGVYSYTAEALEKFVSVKPSYLENLEGLEQLRGLENGLRYGAIEISEETIGVDDPDDVKKVEELLSERAN